MLLVCAITLNLREPHGTVDRRERLMPSNHGSSPQVHKTQKKKENSRVRLYIVILTQIQQWSYIVIVVYTFMHN